MPHREPRSTTSDHFESSLGVRTWLAQFSGPLKAFFLPQGILDLLDLSTKPGSPPPNRIRIYFLGSEISIRLPTGAAYFLWRQETVRELSANATASFMDWVIGTGSWTLSLPAITSSDLGRPVRVTNAGIGLITVDGDGTDKIGDDVSQTLLVMPGQSILLLARSTTKWRLA